MDTRRLILAIVFLYSSFMLWGAWQKYNQPQTVVQTTSTSAVANDTSVPTQTTAQATSSSTALVPTTDSVPASEKAQVINVKTDLFVAEISTLGGDIVGLELNNYKSLDDKDKAFSLFETKHQYVAQSGLIGEGLPSHKTIFKVTGGDRELAPDAKTVQLRLEAPVENGVKVTKVYTFTRGSYLINAAYEIENGSQNPITPEAYYHLQRDTEAPSGESRAVSTITGPAIYTDQNKYQVTNFKSLLSELEKQEKLGKDKIEIKANDGWVAMVQHYFVSVWIPEGSVQRTYYEEKLKGGTNPPIRAGLRMTLPTAAPGAKIGNSVSLYAGPQIQKTLEQLAKPVADGGIGAEGLPLVVDYGWLKIVAAPIFWCLEFIHGFVGNWGWAIVLLTICIKAIFFPLSAASYKSMAKMKTVTPRMTALRERYGDDKAKLNVEMMNLYKTENINPLGGCLPIVIQIPVFIALYRALLGAVEMRDAPWILWIKDLSSQDPYFVLPVIMMATMFIQTKLNPTPPDPIQAKITMFMPLIFGVMFFWFPSGLVLYWVVNNTLSIAQQWQITRMMGGGNKAANDAKA